MYKKILAVLGIRSRCCNAKIVTWHAGKEYCQACEHWINAVIDSPKINNKKIQPKAVTH